VVRTALFVVVLAMLSGAGFAQESSSSSSDANGTTQAAVQDSEKPVAGEVTAAEAAIASSDWKTAAAKLDVYLAAHPQDARALFDAGYVADSQNRVADAEGLYLRSIEADHKRFEAHLSLGLLLAREGKEVEARPELLAATTLDAGEDGAPLKARAWRALAQIDRPLPNHPGDLEAASNDLLEALKISPETEDDTLLAASLAEQTQQYDVAETAYRRALEKDPKSETANAGLGQLLIRDKKYPEAETFLRAALEKLPEDPALNAQLATTLAAENKAEAVPLLQKLHAAHPNDLAVTHMLAQVLSDAGDDAGSDKLYPALLADSPNNPALLVEHGQNLVRMGKFAEAFAAFDKATQIDPANSDGWSGLAFAASRTGQPAVALHALTMRSKYLPESPSTYFLWAISYDSLHQKTQAAAYYHHFLDSAAGKYPDQEWQARQRLQLLEK
jgi:predicted Zn-dependent protease